MPAHRSRRRALAVGALLAAAATAASCGVSSDQEVQLGADESRQIEAQLPLVDDAEITSYVNALGDSMARLTSRGDLEWHFAVVNTSDVNAFALPGGYVYVNRGVIERARTMDELAGVLGHEIEHVVERHAVKQIEKTEKANVGVALTCSLTRICNSPTARAVINAGGTLAFLRFSRADERQADSGGFANVVRAGIDPRGMLTFFQTLLAEERAHGAGGSAAAWFSDHPGTGDRIVDIQRMLAAMPLASRGELAVDSRAYQAVRARVLALPPAPKPDTSAAPEP